MVSGRGQLSSPGSPCPELPLAVLIGKCIKFGTVGHKKRRAPPRDPRYYPGVVWCLGSVVDARTIEVARREGRYSPWIDALADCASGQRVRAIASSMSRRSPLRSISTQRRRWATATIFSTSPTVWDRAPTKCGDTSRRDAAGSCCARSRARRLPFARRDKARHRLRADCV